MDHGPGPSPRQALALEALQRGWPVIRCNGKVAVDKEWEKGPGLNAHEVLSWDGDFGLRTGPPGPTVLDLDPLDPDPPAPKKKPTPDELRINAEWRARYADCEGRAPTPRGGHVMREGAPGVRNSASKLAPGIDVRGEGGYVVLRALPPLPLAPWPAEWTVIKAKTERRATRPARASGDAWAKAALDREIRAVADAPAGTWNIALNVAAFNLGQIVAGGGLSESEVWECLVAASLARGHEGREVEATIRSGIEAGKKEPRVKPERERPPTPPEDEPKPASEPRGAGPARLRVPGHHSDGVGIGGDTFAERIIRILPEGLLYRRAGLVGRITDGAFAPISQHALRTIVDAHAVLYEVKGKEFEHRRVACSLDHAGLILGVAENHSHIRALRAVSPHAVFTREGEILESGWYPNFGLYIASPKLPIASDPFDLVDEFETDGVGRANWVVYMLTVMSRAALRADVPLFCFTAPTWGGGKSWLGLKIPGRILYDRDIPSCGWPKDEDEVSKTLIARCLTGSPVIGLDNVNDTLDSGALASFITSGTIEGRVLTRSQSTMFENLFTVCATGQNLTISGELARRACTTAISPTEGSAQRENWKHKMLLDVTSKRRLACQAHLLERVERWVKAGRPIASGIGMGGFEVWSSTVASIARADGLNVLADEGARRSDNRDNLAAETLIREWAKRYENDEVEVEQIVALADKFGIYQAKLGAGNDRSRHIRLGLILKTLIGRVIGGWSIEPAGRANERAYILKRA